MGVTIHESSTKPDTTIRSDEVILTDARGRVFCIKKPPFTTRFKILRMVGAQNGANEAYVSEILALSWIYSIDGEPVVITTEREAEALLQRLDEEGYVILFEGILKIRDNENNDKKEETNLSKK